MSLIADALKAAQGEKQKRSGGGKDRDLAGFVSMSSPKPKEKPWQQLDPKVIGMAVLALAVGLFGLGRMIFGSDDDAAALLLAPPSSSPAQAQTSPAGGSPPPEGPVAAADEPVEEEDFAEEPDVEEEPVGADMLAGAEGEAAPATANWQTLFELQMEAERAREENELLRRQLAMLEAREREQAEAVVVREASRTPAERAAAVAPPAEEQVARPAGSGANPPAGSGQLRIDVARSSESVAVLLRQALDAQRAGDLAQAEQLYVRALAREPQNAELHNNLGTLLRARGEVSRATEHFRRAITLNPKLAAAWNNLGVALDAQGKKADARAAFQQALVLDPGNLGAKVNLALQYHAIGALPEARKLLEEALGADPGLAEAHYALARLAEEQGDRTAAVRHFGQFLETASGRFPQLETLVRQHLADIGR